MEAPDLSTLSTSFVEFGGQIFRKHVNSWDIDSDILVYKNVKKPQVLPKLSAVGGPRPYRAADDQNQGAKFTDRTLTVEQSKWDYDVDPEIYRNTYLAMNGVENPFYEFILSQVSDEYLGQLNDRVVYTGLKKSDAAVFSEAATYSSGDTVLYTDGSYYQANASTSAGEDPIDTPAKWDLVDVEHIAEGWKSIIEAEITATNITEIATGALTSANAVTKIEQMVEESPVWMKKKGGVIYCSYANFDNYKKHYRTLNGFGFNKTESGEYFIDGYTNIKLRPASWLGTSGRVIFTISGNLVVGTDGDNVSVHATQRRNIIEVRQMMPVGFQVADVEAIQVNDQA